MQRYYMCIDQKTFFATVECVERGLDPFSTNLVVADPERGPGAICLAVSPKMKMLGVKNRCRIFEIPSNIKYITAVPRMKKYIEYAANVYGVFLKYFSKDDIYVYSIDESFIDCTCYLKMYNKNPVELAKMVIKDIHKTYGLTATAGIGTNLYLAKIALDITAKHSVDNIGFLNEEKYKKELWHHKPLTDFWQVGPGTTKRLNRMGIYDMCGIANAEPKGLYKEFGVNAEFLIDHSKGKEPCTIADIKNYKRKTQSFSNSQILTRDYSYNEARVIVKEMVELGSLRLVEENKMTNLVQLYIGYSKDEIKPTGGSYRMQTYSNVFSELNKTFLNIYDKTTDRRGSIRRVGISFCELIEARNEQLNLFIDHKKVERERNLERTINDIKREMGKNAITRGMNYFECATTRERNNMIGGHKSGECG